MRIDAPAVPWPVFALRGVDGCIYDISYDTIEPVRTVVLDTSVLVAGLRSRRGASFQILSMIGGGQFESVVSVPLVFEYEATLKAHSGVLGLTHEAIDTIVGFICGASTQREVFFLWRPTLRDANDDFVLEVAVAGRCDAVVTHNVQDFDRASLFGIEILTPGAFLRRVRREQ